MYIVRLYALFLIMEISKERLVQLLREEYELTADKYDDYRWICEINLPLINETVKSISEKEINAMLNASEKAAKLIDEYMKNHPELEIRNMFKGKRWEINGDENGKFLSMGMSSAWRSEQGKRFTRNH